MGLFWAILQEIKDGNQMLHSMWISDGKKQTMGDFYSISQEHVLCFFQL